MKDALAPEPGTLTPRQKDRRERILVTAYEMLRQNAYEQIQMKDVAAASSVALGTLYRYFPSKERLYATVLYDWATSFYDDEPGWAKLGPIDRLDLRMKRALEAFERRPQFFVVSQMLMHSRDNATKELSHMRVSQLDRAISQDLKDFTPSEAQDISYIIWGTMSQMFMRVGNGSSTISDAKAAMATLMSLVRMRHQSLSSGD